jgi:pimeloyl-ACP methyl ester carboxylesterase
VKEPGKTPAFQAADGSVLASSIAETAYLTLGGIEQWVMIRGENIANPVLILLHGGPGMSETSFFRYFNSSVLEKTFTVIYWDQRGAGRTYSRDTPEASMTIERFVADLDELVDAVRGKLDKNKVVILGHSWGSALGTLYAARHPDKVSAYVGTGQIGDLLASERLSYAFVLAEAGRRHNRRALKQLHAIGEPPYTSKTIGIQRRWLMRFVGLMRGKSFWQVLRAARSTPESSLRHVPNLFRGALFSLGTLWSQVSALNLETAVPELKMPVFFFIGRHDHQVVAETSVAYFEKLIAPSKQFAWFEESAHMPPFEEAEMFNAKLVELVAPIARAAS